MLEKINKTNGQVFGQDDIAKIDNNSTKIENAINLNTNSINNHISDNIAHTSVLDRNNWDDKYTKTEVDTKINNMSGGLNWKTSVATYTAIATTYPTPSNNWAVKVNDTGYSYKYNGSAWVLFDNGVIPIATETNDGLMTKDMVTQVNKIGDLTTSTNTNKTSVVAITNEINASLSKMMKDKIYSVISNINGKKIKLIGDSILAGTGGTGFNPNEELIPGTIYRANESGHCWGNSLKQYFIDKYNCTGKNWELS